LPGMIRPRSCAPAGGNRFTCSAVTGAGRAQCLELSGLPQNGYSWSANHGCSRSILDLLQDQGRDSRQNRPSLITKMMPPMNKWIAISASVLLGPEPRFFRRENGLRAAAGINCCREAGI
jgi:hypothetical protein